MKIQATSFKIIEEGKETRVQLLDKNNNPVSGKNVYWEGSLYLDNNNLTTCKGLEGINVGGSLWLNNNNLTSCKGLERINVGGYLRIDYNNLTSCKGLEGINVGGDLRLDYNNLTSCKGLEGINVGGNLRLDDNNLTKIPTKEELNINSNVFDSFLSKGFLFADNILQKILSTRKKAGLTIYRTEKLGTNKKEYVVERNNTFSHGETLKQAIEDYAYKISDKDTTEYKDWNLKTLKPKEEMIQAYRKITGACSFGVKNCIEKLEIPSELTVGEVIDWSTDNYGNKKFKKFFTRD